MSMIMSMIRSDFTPEKMKTTLKGQALESEVFVLEKACPVRFVQAWQGLPLEARSFEGGREVIPCPEIVNSVTAGRWPPAPGGVVWCGSDSDIFSARFSFS